MHIGEIITADTANGIGIRVSLFVSGCTIHCKGCFQPQTWDFDYGLEYTKEHEDFIVNELKKGYYRGLTILGGEPFETVNQIEIVKLLRRVREECPNADIWMYTGFVYSKHLTPGGNRYTQYTDEILDSIDILVEGPFVECKKNLGLRFRGSENQRILDMKATRAEGKIVLAEYN